MSECLERWMEKAEFPAQAREVLRQADSRLRQDPAVFAEFEALAGAFSADGHAAPIDDVLRRLTALAGRCGVHPYTLHLLFYMAGARPLREKYAARGIPEAIYWNTMADLRYKLAECREVYGVWGTFVGSWFPRFFTLERFALGRLQYELARFAPESYTRGGCTVRRGDRVLSVHIPSAGPLTRESRMDSYRRAYAFFRKERNGGPLVLQCESWLLYPPYAAVFPEGSRIRDFRSDFDIIGQEDQTDFQDAWRVFGAGWQQPPDRLPARTSLQRAFARWFKDGGPAGEGFGVLLFDGSRIL